MNSVNSTFIIFLSIGAFFFFTKPMMADLSALSDKKSAYEEALVKLKSVESIKQQLTDKLNSLPEDEKKKLEILLPDSPGTVKLVSDIDAAAAKNGISIDQITYGPSNHDQGKSVIDATAPKNYQSVLVNFSFTSDYNHLKSFLADLEESLRLIDVRSIDLQVGSKGVYNYKVSVETYSL